jgi:hypothetical protein
LSDARALAAAIRAACLSHAPLLAIVADRIFDDPPPDAAFPYVTFGRFESRPAEAAASAAVEHVVTLHVWSRYGGRAEALDIVAALRGALHNAPLSIVGGRVVLVLAQFSDVFRSGDGLTTHGVLRLRAITEPA